LDSAEIGKWNFANHPPAEIRVSNLPNPSFPKEGAFFSARFARSKRKIYFLQKKTTVFSLFLKREGEAGVFKLQGGSRDGDLIEVKHLHKKQLTCHLGGRLTPLLQRRRFVAGVFKLQEESRDGDLMQGGVRQIFCAKNLDFQFRIARISTTQNLIRNSKKRD